MLSVTVPDGTITQTTRGDVKPVGEFLEGRHVGDLRSRVVTHHLVAARRADGYAC